MSEKAKNFLPCSLKNGLNSDLHREFILSIVIHVVLAVSLSRDKAHSVRAHLTNYLFSSFQSAFHVAPSTNAVYYLADVLKKGCVLCLCVAVCFLASLFIHCRCWTLRVGLRVYRCLCWSARQHCGICVLDLASQFVLSAGPDFPGLSESINITSVRPTGTK